MSKFLAKLAAMFGGKAANRKPSVHKSRLGCEQLGDRVVPTVNAIGPFVEMPGGENSGSAAIGDPFGNGRLHALSGNGPDHITVSGAVELDTNALRSTAVSSFGGFRGGVEVASGDLFGTGRDLTILGPQFGGGPRVLAYDTNPDGTNVEVLDFLGIEDEGFRGGIRVATGDVTGDGRDDLVVAAGFGGGPRVQVWEFSTGRPVRVANFFAFEEALRNGAFVAVGDLNGDGFGEVIAGGGPGGGPRVTAFDGASLVRGNLQVVANGFVGPNIDNRGGVRVAAKDLDGDGLAEIAVGSGDGDRSVVSIVSHDLRTLVTAPTPIPITAGTAITVALDVHPDGRAVLLTQGRDAAGVSHIFKADVSVTRTPPALDPIPPLVPGPSEPLPGTDPGNPPPPPPAATVLETMAPNSGSTVNATLFSETPVKGFTLKAGGRDSTVVQLRFTVTVTQGTVSDDEFVLYAVGGTGASEIQVERFRAVQNADGELVFQWDGDRLFANSASGNRFRVSNTPDDSSDTGDQYQLEFLGGVYLDGTTPLAGGQVTTTGDRTSDVILVS